MVGVVTWGNSSPGAVSGGRTQGRVLRVCFISTNHGACSQGLWVKNTKCNKGLELLNKAA